DCNSGSKTIAVNLPNDEAIQSKYGTRRSQLKNTMQAKFDHILVPIANQLLDPEQAKRIRFETFFMNVMFHEVAHGLGVKSTNRGLTPREALKEQHSWIEEEKADVLGLWLIAELYRRGEIKEGQMMDHYITFLAGILRSSRFGASSAHGLANMHTFNFLM
ncbi:MAG: Zn-dependent hydrolase, partial [Bacteroidota bacterium]